MDKIIINLVALLFNNQASAADGYITYGVGNYSCGKYVKEQNEPMSGASGCQRPEKHPV